MRKNIIGALIASAFAMSGTAQAGLLLDVNGIGPGGVINATAFDWTQTSFLAQGGNAAINQWINTGGACGGNVCNFTVETHARLGTYTAEGGSAGTPLPAGFGQITMVARIEERVNGFTLNQIGTGLPAASFVTTGVGVVELYYNPTVVANDLTGFGFNAGRLIASLTGTTVGSNGVFGVTDATPVVLDGFGADDYNGQQTVTGGGTQLNPIAVGLSPGGIVLDPEFFLTTLAGFSLNYNNISIGIPYGQVDPSDCFNGISGSRTVGLSYSSTCDNLHGDAAQNAANFLGQFNPTGYTPNVGNVNGLNRTSPDFIAQTDFNSAVNGVPEPGSLALVGLALAASGLVASRRRRA